MIFLWIVIITFIAGVIGTGLGGLTGAILRKDSNKVVSLLLSFAGGVMLAVVCFDLMQSALHPTDEEKIPFYFVVIFVAIGYLLVALFNRLIDKKTNKEINHIDESHPDAHDDLDELIHSNHLVHHKGQSKELFMAGVIMALVIALHNLPEGIVIGAGYALDKDFTISGAGLIMAVVIGLHNIPEGMAVSVPLISGGMKKSKAVLLTALSGAPTIIGAVIGYAVGLISPIMLSLALSFASGAMLYVVFGELLPESILMWKSKMPALFLLIGLLVGFILVQI